MKTVNEGAFGKLLKLGSSIRKDGWVNTITGLGLSSKDSRVGAKVLWTKLSETEIENLYAADDIAAKVVDKIPNAGTRKWVEFSVPDDLDEKEAAEACENEFDRLNVRTRFKKAWKWARLYGGAGIFVAVDDGEEDLSQPLIPENIREIKSLTVFNRFELNPGFPTSDIEDPNFGLPETYSVSPRAIGGRGIGSTSVHHTRIIRFDSGAELPTVLKQSNQWWNDSILSRLYNVLRNFNGAHDSIANVIQDFRVGIIKLKDLADIVTSEESEVLKTRLEMMNLAKSVMSAVVLDAEDESFETNTTSLANVDEVMRIINNRLVAATDMPHTIILGEGAQGQLGASGESENSDFMDTVAEQQEDMLRDPLDRIKFLIMSAQRGPTRGEIADVTINFRSLWQMDDKEQAEVHLKQAQADSLYLDRGVIDPDEVAMSRFGGEKFSLNTTLDLELREGQRGNGSEDPGDRSPNPGNSDPSGGSPRD